MRNEKDSLVMTSGRRISANCGVVGINAYLEVHEGYDGRVQTEGDEYFGTTWTVVERAELADYMIDLWMKFKHATEGGQPTTESLEGWARRRGGRWPDELHSWGET